MRKFVFLGLTLLSSLAFAGEQTRPTTPFTSIRTQGALIVEVEVGSAYSIKVKGDDKFLAKIVTDISGDELLINYKEKNNNNVHLSDDLKVIVTLPALSKFKMEGVGMTTVNNISGNYFELAYEGVGVLKMKGKVANFKLRAHGVGHVDAKGLIAENVDAVVEGVGSVDVYASEKLKANVNGIGSLNYFGNPKSINKTADGIGSVKAGK
ncbi:MAG: DUF2807 domain-containing protein [Undibacterium sp.]|nr:DUF2807 domain-containing protein [Undibacterium sp.]